MWPKQVLKKLKSMEEIEMSEFHLCLWWLFTAYYGKYQILCKSPCSLPSATATINWPTLGWFGFFCASPTPYPLLPPKKFHKADELKTETRNSAYCFSMSPQSFLYTSNGMRKQSRVVQDENPWWYRLLIWNVVQAINLEWKEKAFKLWKRGSFDLVHVEKELRSFSLCKEDSFHRSASEAYISFCMWINKIP